MGLLDGKSVNLSKMKKLTRGSGFYRVKIKPLDRPVIAEWSNLYHHWTMCGTRARFHDDSFSEIDEERIIL